MNKLLYVTCIVLLVQSCASTVLKRQEGNANLNAAPKISENFEGVFIDIADAFAKAYPGTSKQLNKKFVSSPVQPEFWYPHIFVADVELQEVLKSSCSGSFGRFQESPSSFGRYYQYFNRQNPDYKYHKRLRESYYEEKQKHKYDIEYKSIWLNEMHEKQDIDLFKYNNSDAFRDSVTNGEKYDYSISGNLRVSLLTLLKRKIRETKINDKKITEYNNIGGNFEPLVSYFCFTDINKFEVIALGQITRKSGFGYSVQFSGYFNQDDFKQAITKATDDYVAGFQKQRMITEQTVRRKELDKLKQIRKVEADKKKRIEHTEQIALSKKTWDNRFNTTYKLGDSVCTWDNKMAFIEQKTNEKMKILIKGELASSYLPGYFFGHQPLYDYDKSFKYEKEESITWLPRNQIGHCGFNL